MSTQSSSSFSPTADPLPGLVEQTFNTTFARFNTVLIGGQAEPLYQPASATDATHTLYYREDYFASALHETAHWCIAGEERRRLVDFGYWYEPDGRDANSQRAFEQVEVKPQALEWFFSQACGQLFRVSEDNLAMNPPINTDVSETQASSAGDTPFARAVLKQALRYQSEGLPARAGQFFTALAEAFGTGMSVGKCVFSPEAVR